MDWKTALQGLVKDAAKAAFHGTAAAVEKNPELRALRDQALTAGHGLAQFRAATLELRARARQAATAPATPPEVTGDVVDDPGAARPPTGKGL